MSNRSRTVRWVALLSAGAIGLHQLRYVVADPANAHQALAGNGHSYLPLAIALVLLLFGASLVHFATTLVLARGGELREPRRISFARAWAIAAPALLAIFISQESLEGALLGGHMAGAHGLFGHGGWSVFLLAPLIGAAIGLLLKGAANVVARVARRRARRRLPTTGPYRPRVEHRPSPLNVLACNLAGRAPPHLS
jgi:hypothetical protein